MIGIHLYLVYRFPDDTRNNMLALIDVMLSKTLYRVCCSSS